MTGTPNRVLTMPGARRPFADEVVSLLSERGMSQRALERATGFNQAHLSRVLAGQKPPSPGLIAAVAEALELAPDYFIESQLALISDRLAGDASLRDRVYRLVKSA
jgi:transcriptional regulator with XRE-family HTH domain